MTKMKKIRGDVLDTLRNEEEGVVSEKRDFCKSTQKSRNKFHQKLDS